MNCVEKYTEIYGRDPEAKAFALTASRRSVLI